MGVDLDELARYFDGELPATRASYVARAVGRDEAARTTIAEWASVGDALRMWARAQPRLSAQMADPIMSQIEGPKRSTGSKLRQGPKSFAGAGPRTALATACAVAAGFFLVLDGSNPRVSQGPDRLKPVIAPGLEVVDRVDEHPASDRDGAALLALDSGGRQVAVFFVAADRGSTPVVWLLDDPPVGSERVQPL